jgi:hypothetical protein
MKRICIATLFCCLLGFLLATTTIPSQLDLKPEVPAKSVVNTLRLLNTPEYSYHEEARQFATIPSQVDPPTEISAESLVNTLRFLNTHEYWYHEEAGHFASRKDIVAFLRTKKLFNQSPINLEYPGVLELAITTVVDGKHYSISLKPRINPVSDTWRCAPAAFTDETGVIFLGSALGCGDSPRYLQPLKPVQ